MPITNIAIERWRSAAGRGMRIAVASITLTPTQFTARYGIQFIEYSHDMGICAAAAIGLGDRMFLLEAFPEWKETNFVQISCPSSEPDPVAAIDALLEELELNEDEISTRRIAWEPDPVTAHDIVQTFAISANETLVAIDVATTHAPNVEYQALVIKPGGEIVACLACKEVDLSLKTAPIDGERYALKGIQESQIPLGSRLRFLGDEKNARATWIIN